ncbi:MAG: family 78 glycoside hydrolase catalytic domain [Cyclobacteriaceae bacterium]
MKKLAFLACIAWACQSLQTQSSQIQPSKLTCEYLSNPSVVDVQQPRVGWVNTAITENRGLSQSAYQIRVATSQEKLTDPDLWDSGKIKSQSSIRIPYDGTPLASRTECWWQVRVWDQDNQVSSWSEPGFWRMGLLKSSDWQAKWIGAPWQDEKAIARPDKYPDQQPEDFGPPAPILRKSFQLNRPISKAVAYVTGLGYFEFYANGNKVGNDVLIPNQTNYGKRPKLGEYYINVADNFKRYKVMYLAYDITELLAEGNNVLGAVLGNGFYNPAKFWAEGYGSPRFLGQVHITYSDGTEEIIKSDATWKAAKSAILKNMVYYGEHYDARLEQTGWSNPQYNDESWSNVSLKSAPAGELVAHTSNTDKVTEHFSPKTIERLPNGNHYVDFGTEISGWVSLNNVQAPKGHQIDISFNSNLYSGDNTYVFKGEDYENYEPRFNWFVFSGIEIKNWYGELLPEHLTAKMINTEINESATFETSNSLFNNINKIWRRSQIDNMHGGIVSDCPHRERSAYTGDGQVACATVMHNYDARNFYYKWMQDISEAQNVETGYVPNGAPWQPGCGGGVAWGAAIGIIPWEFYQQYGARDVLEAYYPAMKAYIKYMQTWVNENGIMHSQRRNGSGQILKWFNLGDWAPPGELVRDDLVHTFYFWRCVEIASKSAEILGLKQESNTFMELAQRTKNAFHTAFYNPELKSYGNEGANIFALKMGVPVAVKTEVLQSLQKNILSNEGHFDTGIFGTRYFFQVLAENGLNHLAYDAMNKTIPPSFGHWLESGATTTREHWGDEGSHNHPMFGGGLIWFYQQLAGMRPDPNIPGYQHIIFKPNPVPELSFVKYENETPYGKAGIHWKQQQDAFEMNITVPVGSTATVYVPSKSRDSILESDNKPFNGDNIRFIRSEGDYQLFDVSSGTYAFSTKPIIY